MASHLLEVVRSEDLEEVCRNPKGQREGLLSRFDLFLEIRRRSWNHDANRIRRQVRLSKGLVSALVSALLAAARVERSLRGRSGAYTQSVTFSCFPFLRNRSDEMSNLGWKLV